MNQNNRNTNRQFPYVEKALTDIQKLNLCNTEKLLDTVKLGELIPQFLRDGESLLYHTEHVINNFYKYFSKGRNSSILPHDFFVLLLLFHDIGKPQASRDGDKNMQHAYSEKIIREFFNEFGYDNESIDLGVSIVCIDPIGEYLQGNSTLEEALSAIHTSFANIKNHVTHKEFFELLLIYYVCDASSYDFLHHLFEVGNNHIEFAKHTNIQINMLRKGRKEYNNTPWLQQDLPKTYPEKNIPASLKEQVDQFIEKNNLQKTTFIVRYFDMRYYSHVLLAGTDRYFEEGDRRIGSEGDAGKLDKHLGDQGLSLSQGIYGEVYSYTYEEILHFGSKKNYGLLLYDKSKLSKVGHHTRTFNSSPKDALIGVLTGTIEKSDLEERLEKATGSEEKIQILEEAIYGLTINFEGEHVQFTSEVEDIKSCIKILKKCNINLQAKEYLTYLHEISSLTNTLVGTILFYIKSVQKTDQPLFQPTTFEEQFIVYKEMVQSLIENYNRHLYGKNEKNRNTIIKVIKEFNNLDKQKTGGSNNIDIETIR